MKQTVILVVEDEAIIRFNTVSMIEEAGYEVLEASCSEEAIAILESRADVHVVFSDIEMPGSMNGLQLLHAIRERWPPVVLILASGRVSPRTEEMPASTTYLAKPYSAQDLLDAIAKSARQQSRIDASTKPPHDLT